MRIGLDARWIFPEITGIGSYTQELIRHLVRLDTDNEYLLFFGSEAVRDRTADYAGLDQAAHVTSAIVPYGPFSPKSQLLLPGLIRRARLDVFHSTNFMIPFPGFPRNRRGRTACVVTIHDLIPLLFPEHTPRALKTRFHPVYRRVMKEVGLRADRSDHRQRILAQRHHPALPDSARPRRPRDRHLRGRLRTLRPGRTPRHRPSNHPVRRPAGPV
jgi:hypothetical protein